MFNSPFLTLLQNTKPTHIICEDKGKVLTAKELEIKSLALAENLEKQGLKHGDHVLFACESGIEFLILFMALIHIRVKIALVDPHMGPALYWAKVKQFQPQWAFIDSRLLLLQEHPIIRWFYRKSKPKGIYIPYSKSYKVFATGRRLPLFQKHRRLKSETQNSKLRTCNTNDELVLVYTSGTLAEPKAVVHTVNSLFESLQAISNLFANSEAGATMVTHLPHFALIGMITGYKTYFWKEELSAEKRIKFIEEKRITAFFGPPAEYLPLMEYCKENKRKFPACLTQLMLGSAPVIKPFLQELRKYTEGKITCMYGMTESLVVATIDGDEKLKAEVKGDLLGKPFAGLDYMVEEDGELLINSPLTFSRYFHNENRPELHATGDLVYLDELGRFVLKGRKKNMIIRGNKNIYPALYEDTIAGIEGIKEAIMVGIYNETKHDEDVILVVDAEKNLTEKYIMKQLLSGKHAIDSDALPDYIFLLPIPKSGRQMKPDKEALITQIKPLLSKNTT